MRLFLRLQIPIVLLVAAAYFLVVWPLHNPHPKFVFPEGTLAIRDVRIYITPDSDPIEHGTVLARTGIIVAAGQNIAIPQDTNIVECPNCTVTAGFWNSHVHFTESEVGLRGIQIRRHAECAARRHAFQPRLHHRGRPLLRSRARPSLSAAASKPAISKDLLIYTAGLRHLSASRNPLLSVDLPFYVRWMMPQPETPEAAAKIEERNIRIGADVLKLFTGSIVAPHQVLPMPRRCRDGCGRSCASPWTARIRASYESRRNNSRDR